MHQQVGSAFTIHGASSFYFTELDGLNMELYMDETKNIKESIQKNIKEIF